MKPAVALGWSSGAIILIVLMVLVGMKLTVWSGPDLEISVIGPEAKVESIFLGDYQLGITRLRIESDAPLPVVDLKDSRGGIPNVFGLRVGENQIANSDGSIAQFMLTDAKSYLLTLCGNNGWGRIRCSSQVFRLTRH
jgi:hypothetical protein